ncbi:MAG: trypsin-like serine protease [Ruminococcaceae bacterium]|nr:trypsin-like serine protease [Oscillospiraceae bacterium]
MNENENREQASSASQQPVEPSPMQPEAGTAPAVSETVNHNTKPTPGAPTDNSFISPAPAQTSPLSQDIQIPQPAATIPPSPVPTAPPSAKSSSSVLAPILICLTVALAAFCAILCVILLSGGKAATAVIYENGNWVNEGELVSDEAIVNTVAKTSPSVVAITTESVSYNALLGNFVSEGAGSGVICTADGYIITNHHVIQGADNIRVTLENGDTHEAELIGSDAQTDLAVIKINADGLVPAVYANADSLSVGQTVIAIGNPLGTLSNTVTSGVVSALARQINIGGTTMTLLQHNASVSPGNSGGGLFNLNGELVGIVNAKSSGEGVEGVGFAIPVDTFRSVVQALIESGYVTGRPQLGITAYEVLSNQSLYSLPEEIRTCVIGINAFGVYIGNDSAVTYAKNSQKLQPGDYIASIDDQLIQEFSDIAASLSDKKTGDTVQMTVYRYNQESKKTLQVHVSIILGERTQ